MEKFTVTEGDNKSPVKKDLHYGMQMINSSHHVFYGFP